MSLRAVLFSIVIIQHLIYSISINYYSYAVMFESRQLFFGLASSAICVWPSGGLCPLPGAPGEGAEDPGVAAAGWRLGHHGNPGVRGVTWTEPDAQRFAAAKWHRQAAAANEQCE